MAESQNRIGVIVTWFGELPTYFQAWLKSAEYNSTIDFIIISDQDVFSDKTNIITHKTTLSEEIGKYRKQLNRKIVIDEAYKFCDCRLFFGQLYADLLEKYDFWGYCDIDLIFGDIRKFVTGEVLKQYDRIYMYGHLCLYRNCDDMNHIYDKKGGIYSPDEIFEGKAKTTPEEHYGVNRICRINRIPTYTRRDFADLFSFLPHRFSMSHDKNYEHQLFLWDKGHVYRVYGEDGEIQRQELVYVHFQKRKPVPDCESSEFSHMDRFIISPEQFITAYREPFTMEDLDRYNPPVSRKEFKKYRHIYLRNKMQRFFRSPFDTKKIWIRQMRYRIMDKVLGN